jgi:hypothetical protein
MLLQNAGLLPSAGGARLRYGAQALILNLSSIRGSPPPLASLFWPWPGVHKALNRREGFAHYRMVQLHG